MNVFEDWSEFSIFARPEVSDDGLKEGYEEDGEADHGMVLGEDQSVVEALQHIASTELLTKKEERRRETRGGGGGGGRGGGGGKHAD